MSFGELWLRTETLSQWTHKEANRRTAIRGKKSWRHQPDGEWHTDTKGSSRKWKHSELQIWEARATKGNPLLLFALVMLCYMILLACPSHCSGGHCGAACFVEAADIIELPGEKAKRQMIHRFKHRRMAQGKLGAADKHPHTVTQAPWMHTKTDNLWESTHTPDLERFTGAFWPTERWATVHRVLCK